MKKAALWLIMITIISNLLGFGKDLVLSYFYGASETTDVYLIAITIATAIFSFLGSAVSTSYVPMYRQVELEEGKSEARKYTNNLLNILFLFITLILMLGLIFTEELVLLFASGFKGTTLHQAIMFTKISLFGGYFTVSLLLLNAYLRLHNRFIVPAVNAIVGHIVIMVFIYISTLGNVKMLIIGTVIANILQVCFLIPFLKGSHYKYAFLFNIKDKNIQKTIKIAFPVIISDSIMQINLMIDRTLASLIVVGGISALSYANKINGFVQSVFVLSIAHIMYPLISKMATKNNIKDLKESLQTSIGIIIMLVLPATAGVMVLSEPIIQALFGRGAFDTKATILTSSALFFYSIGMVGSGLREIISRTFYALQDTKTPMINASLAVLLNIVLNLLLSKYMGVSGLALATSIAGITSALLLYLSLRRKIGSLGTINLLRSFVKILLSSIIMGVIVYTTYNITVLHFNEVLTLIISIFIGVFTYFTFLYLFRLKEFQFIYRRLIKR